MAEPLLLCTYGGPILMDIKYRRQYLSERQVLLRHHLPRFREGLVDAIVIPVDSTDEAALLLLEISEAEGKIRLARTPSEVRAAKAEGVVAVLLGVSFDALGSRPELLYLYRELGMCLFPLALNPRNLLTDGCGERTGAGLSRYGIQVVRQLERCGALVDISHTSDAGFRDVAEVLSGPFVASHSNSRALCENPRNLTDEQACTIAAHGGFVALSTYPTLVSQGDIPSLEDYLDHLDYFVRLIGPEHVAIGADLVDYVKPFILPKVKATDPTGAMYGEREDQTRDLAGIEDMKKVVEGLARRGYNVRDRESILGSNFLRVWESVRIRAGLPV